MNMDFFNKISVKFYIVFFGLITIGLWGYIIHDITKTNKQKIEQLRQEQQLDDFCHMWAIDEARWCKKSGNCITATDTYRYYIKRKLECKGWIDHDLYHDLYLDGITDTVERARGY